MTGLYIHVPLCISRCRYCDFYKLTPGQVEGMAVIPPVEEAFDFKLRDFRQELKEYAARIE